MHHLPDAELVRRCREGSAEAWNELVERFSRYVYAVCERGFRLGAHDAEDAFQEVFTRVYARLDTLRDDSAIRPWIGQLTRRVCLDRLAAAAHEQPAEDVPDEQLERTIEEIDDPCRELLDRFFARDESYRTIGEALDLPPGTIASRLSRCLGKMRSHLEGRKPDIPGSGRER